MDEIKVGDRVKVIKQPPHLSEQWYIGLVGEVAMVDQWDPVMEILVRTDDNEFWCQQSGVVKINDRTFGDSLDEDQKLSALKVGQWVEVTNVNTLGASEGMIGRKQPIVDSDGEYTFGLENTVDSAGGHWWFEPSELRVLSSDEILARPARLAAEEAAVEAWVTAENMDIGMERPTVVLNSSDPFESALIDIVTINRRKRADYATDNDIFSNFRGAGARTGLNAGKIVDVMIAIKDERLRALQANGRDPQNESVLDTLLDRAVYGVIGYAIGKEQ